MTYLAFLCVKLFLLISECLIELLHEGIHFRLHFYWWRPFRSVDFKHS